MGCAVEQELNRSPGLPAPVSGKEIHGTASEERAERGKSGVLYFSLCCALLVELGKNPAIGDCSEQKGHINSQWDGRQLWVPHAEVQPALGTEQGHCHLPGCVLESLGCAYCSCFCKAEGELGHTWPLPLPVVTSSLFLRGRCWAGSSLRQGGLVVLPGGAHQFCGCAGWKRLLERGVRPLPPPALLLHAVCCLCSLPTCCQAGERDAGHRRTRWFNSRAQRRCALRMELMAHRRIYKTDWGRTL